MPSDEGITYSAGQFPYSYFFPFLEAFDTLRVVARHADLGAGANTGGLNISSGDRVSFRLLPNINNPAGLLRHYAQAKEALAEELEHADAVIIRAVSDIGWILYKLAKKAGKPVAMEMAACGWDSTWNHGNRYGKIYAPIRYIRDRIITKNADYVLYVSHEFLPNRYPTNAVTTFASNVRIERPENEMLDYRIARIKDLYETDRPICIGLIGTLKNNLKGVKDALKAIALIEKQCHKKIEFRVLGSGDEKSFRELEKKLGLKSKVYYDGLLRSGQEVLMWLDGIDLYIQPSYQEGVPRATIEAMSRACPAIGSTAGGIPELLPAKWLHQPGDIKKLAQLLVEMTNDPVRQIAHANRNYEKSSDYSADILMPKRIEFWRDFADFIAEKAARKKEA